MFKLLWSLSRSFFQRVGSRPRLAKTFTLAEVEAMPKGHPALIGIALTHTDEAVACAAAERLVDRGQRWALVHEQEALLPARMIALRELQSDEKLMLEIAISRENTILTMFAAHFVRNRFVVRRLQESPYPAVRLIGLMKENDPAQLERILKDADPEIRSRAKERLQKLQAN